MEENELIEMNIADTIIERPTGFNIGRQRYFLYPPTLGKTYLLARLLKNLEVNSKMISMNPYMEALRLCKDKRDIVCRIISYFTFCRKEDVLDNASVDSRARRFDSKMSEEELATILVLILTNDNTESFIQYLGIDKDRAERRRIESERNSVGTIVFGGKSTYGTLIDFACQRYGWTMEYVVWGISYANLKMLTADAITSIYLNEEERKRLHIFDNKEYINADDPRNKELIREMLND